jgi:hypothetical protein
MEWEVGIPGKAGVRQSHVAQPRAPAYIDLSADSMGKWALQDADELS